MGKRIGSERQKQWNPLLRSWPTNYPSIDTVLPPPTTIYPTAQPPDFFSPCVACPSYHQAASAAAAICHRHRRAQPPWPLPFSATLDESPQTKLDFVIFQFQFTEVRFRHSRRCRCASKSTVSSPFSLELQFFPKPSKHGCRGYTCRNFPFDCS